MNGYHARVQRHRRELAELASRGEQTAVSSFDLIATMAEGIAEAAYGGKRHGHPANGDDDRHDEGGDK